MEGVSVKCGLLGRVNELFLLGECIVCVGYLWLSHLQHQHYAVAA